jgi:adenosylhomocysteine nucleosidase
MAAASARESRICISFALPQEVAPFRRRARRLPEGQTKNLRAGVSGAGSRSAARHAAELLNAVSPDAALLLICGFAGSLDSAGVGDVIVADRVLDCTAPDVVCTEYRADPRLLATAGSVRLPGIASCVGALATTNRVLLNGEEKREFVRSRGLRAAGVDMETAGAARVAATLGVPWLAIRVVTDRFDEPLPFDFNALADGDGNVAIGRVIAEALTHPGKIPALARFGRQSVRAADNLTKFLTALLPALSGNALPYEH